MKKSNDKGFTIIEIVIAMAMTAIIMVMSTTMIFSAFGTMDTVGNMNTTKMFGDSVMRVMADTLKFATEIDIEPTYGSVVHGGDYFVVIDGKIWRRTEKGTDITNQELYGGLDGKNKGIALSVTARDGTLLDIRVAVLGDGGSEVYVTEKTYDMVNLRLAGKEITGVVGTAVENPMISIVE